MTDFHYGDDDPFDTVDATDNAPMPRSSAPRFLTEMADVLRAAGLAVTEVDGWRTRARGSGGYTGGKPWCVMWHHTASNTTPANDVSYIINSQDAPLANLYLARDGTVHVCAAGATNTNGKGGPVTMSKGTVAADSMNTAAIGVEMANDGVGQAWPQVQIDAAFAMSIALCKAYGLTSTDICTHAAWSPGRKIDPATAAAVQGPWRPASINTSGSWSVDDLRDEHTNRWSTAPSPEPEPSEDEMYLATLQDGTVVVVGSSVRPVSGDEIAAGGALADLPRFTPDPASYWHMWLAAGSAEYAERVGAYM